MALQGKNRSRWRSWAAKACLVALALTSGSVSAREADGAAGSDASGDAMPLAAAVAFEGRRAAAATGTPLVLEVRVNRVAQGLAPFQLIDEQLWAPRSVLIELGLKLEDAAIDLGEPVSLMQLFGDDVSFDAARQSLDIMVDADKLAVGTSLLNLDTQSNPVVQSATGALINYDAYLNLDEGGTSFDAATEARFFSGNFLLENTAILRTGEPDSIPGDDIVRLDTSAVLALPDRRLTLRAGDIITRAVGFSRPSRIGGIMVGTDFALQPYLITAPLPRFAGQATLPSTVDLYIDGIKRYSGEVTPGPFEVGAGPNSVNGLGNAEVVVTDLLGQVTRLDFPLYETPLLLGRGLSDWSVEAGKVRRNYSLRSFDYSDGLVGSASYRRGMTDRLTLEAHGEVAGGLWNAGTGAAFAIPRAGVVTGSIAASRNEGKSGHRFEAGYSFIHSDFNLAATLQRASSDYADIASREGALVPRERDLLSAGYSTERWGSFGVSVLRQRYEGERHRSYASGTWSKPMTDRLALSVSANMNLEHPSERGVFLSLSWAPGKRDRVRAGIQANEQRTSASLGWRRSLPIEGGTGFAADAQIGQRVSAAAQIDHLGRLGQATAGARYSGRTIAGYAGFSGSVAVMDGRPYLSRKIQDGFALVTTAALPGVPVSLNNRAFGRTDSRGRILVTGLNGYQENQLSIAVEDLPPDIQVGEVKRQAVPASKAGVLIEFDLKANQAVLLSAVDEKGQFVPTGSPAWRTSRSDDKVMAGFDGMLYFEQAKPGEKIIVESVKGRCGIELPRIFPQSAAGRLGELTCRRLD